MQTKEAYGGLDLFRLAAAAMVVAIHTSPLEAVSPDADFFVTRILARTAVPFFLMVTGQFLPDDWSGALCYLKKIALLYLGSALLYFPIGIYAGHYKELTVADVFRIVMFDGTFYHLWYFPACMLGIVLVFWMRRFWTEKITARAAVVLYLIGLFGDSYYGLIEELPLVSDFYEVMFCVFSYTRNGIFFVPLFLLMGKWVGAKRSPKTGRTRDAAGCLICFLLMTAEGFVLRYFDLQRHDSMYLALPACLYFLYRLLLSCPARQKPQCRTISSWVYVLHPFFIVAVRGAVKWIGLAASVPETPVSAIRQQEGNIMGNRLIFYLLVCGSSFLAAQMIAWGLKRLRRKPFTRGRAWAELDKKALRYNVKLLRRTLPAACELMPAVKANAYGHGAVQIARELNGMGIRSFCVACVEEGVQLRKAGIRGEILILGYTHPAQFCFLARYRLTQTALDFSYARQLNQYGRRLQVHIAVDTGMHRLGEPDGNMARILKMCRMRHLKVTGVYTHLCAADMTSEAARAYTKEQARKLGQVADAIRQQEGIALKVHLLASYGAVAYPEFSGDYARVGIALYGVPSTEGSAAGFEEFRPVLSIRARVAAVKDLHAGDYAGYGMAYRAERQVRLAVIAVGYADGIPRSLSDGVGSVLLHGRRAPVAGRICMDMMTVDVTDIESVHVGDIAVLIGRSGEEEISACEYAKWDGTIANEILSRLGQRLERIVVNV